MNPKKMIWTAGLLCLALAIGYGSEISIITNPANDTVSLTQDELRKIFTGKKRSWQNGNRIMIILMKRGSLHDHFLEEVVKQNSTQFSIAWKKLIFTGKAPLLNYAQSEEEMVEMVRRYPHAIGYVGPQSDLEGVKTIFIRD